MGVVWLVGMMGAGKSAVGEALARKLGRSFVDTDERVERGDGRTIAEIFEREGEAGFRRLEAETIEAVAREAQAACEAGGQGAVVALGGGAIAQPGVPERLARAGIVVYLRASPERLAERIEGSGGASARPLLAELAPAERVERLRALLARREPAYGTAAITVDTDGRGVCEVVRELERRVRERETAA